MKCPNCGGTKSEVRATTMHANVCAECDEFMPCADCGEKNERIEELERVVEAYAEADEHFGKCIKTSNDVRCFIWRDGVHYCTGREALYDKARKLREGGE